MTMKVLSDEKKKRLNLLRVTGIDVDGFGLINTFFYYDEIIRGFGRFSLWLHEHGLNVLAIKASGIKVSQSFKYGSKAWHTLTIVTKLAGTVSHDGWRHDQDPVEAEGYVVKKYGISLL